MVRTTFGERHFRVPAAIGLRIDVRVLLCMLLLVLALWGGNAHAQAPVVTAMPGKFYLGLGDYDLSALGYTTAEFSVAGNATSYNLKGEASADGRWEVVPAATAQYVTRIVVVRPTDPAKFNGSVVIEWLTVSGAVDAAVDWTSVHRELIRDGFAYVAVSAQKAGIDPGGRSTISNSNPLKSVDAARYSGLIHPGDAFAYDIYSQSGRLLKGRQQGARLLGPLVPKRLIAIGES
jgi:hypothetical protein